MSHGQLGWISDGPFYAYLRGGTYAQTLHEGNGGSATTVPLGELHVSEENGNASVSIDFTLPTDVPPGEYWILVCNDPCTTGVGDLIGGVLYVGIDPPLPAEEITAGASERVESSIVSAVVVAQEVDTPAKTNSSYLALAPHRSRPAGLSAAWMAMSAGLAAVVLGLTVVSLRRSGTI